MILKGSQRSGAKQLGLHLMKTEENEHVEIHEVSGFVDETLMGAMKESYALSLGTRCKQHLFSVSLNPPIGENVRVDVFENALRMVEEKTGLAGQPRIVVFHEKEGRRHCHAVWSRIDPETMTAKPLPYFKTKLREVAKQLYLENGWQLPQGFVDSKLRDPRNFSLDEWQQAKRANVDPAEIKAAVQESWATSDSPSAFASALEERGLYVAQGDRRGHVVLNIDGDVFVLSRLADKRSKDVTAKLGDPAKFRSIEETRKTLAGDMTQRLKSHIVEAKRIGANVMKPLDERKRMMKETHQEQRQTLKTRQSERSINEQRERASRIRGGLKGVLDIVTGRYWKTRKQNEVEAHFCAERDKGERDNMVRTQLEERGELQSSIASERDRQARQLSGLYRDAAKFKAMRETGAQQERNRGLELG